MVILGPTATGKTKLAVKLASKFNGEIVSADSRQVYKGMDIGTGKDLDDYVVKKQGTRNKEQGVIKIHYHLIDVVQPNTEYNLAKYKKAAIRAINDIIKRGKTPFLVGGTGLYISAIVDNYDIPKVGPDKKIRNKLAKIKLEEKVKLLKKLDSTALKFIDVNNPRRLDRALEVCLAGQKFSQTRKKKDPLYDVLQISLTFPKKILNKRIDVRVDVRIKQGMIKEVQKLHKNGVSWRRLEDFGLEYRMIAQHLQGKLDQQEMIDKLKIAIHQFAKRQMTWFKRDKRIRWVKNYKSAEKFTKSFLSSRTPVRHRLWRTQRRAGDPESRIF